MSENTLEEALADFAWLVHENARDKGFWEEYDQARDVEQPNVTHTLAKLALVASEVGELVEAVRRPGPSEHIPDFSSAEEEAADIIIRLLDLSVAMDWRLPQAILAKHTFNRTRPRKHGKLA